MKLKSYKNQYVNGSVQLFAKLKKLIYSLFPQDTGLFPKMRPPSAQTDCPQESGPSS